MKDGSQVSDLNNGTKCACVFRKPIGQNDHVVILGPKQGLMVLNQSRACSSQVFCVKQVLENSPECRVPDAPAVGEPASLGWTQSCLLSTHSQGGGVFYPA